MHSALRPSPNGAAALPLLPIYLFTFLNSIGTGVVTNGIVFLTKQGYHFSDPMNYLLAVVLGVTYVAGALGAQPALGYLRRTWPTLSSRAVLAAMMVTMGCLCALPALARLFQIEEPWPIWVMILLYSPLTGVLWPVVESYVSGGRSGDNLLASVSRWNVVWSSALVLAYFGISPFIEKAPALTLVALGAVHLLAGGILPWLSKEPAPNRDEEHQPHPPVFTKLLVTFRLLLPMSYVVSSALGPYLPSAMTRLNVPKDLQTILAASWLGPRVIMFAVLERWQGWHGRWFPAIAGPVLLLAGFGVAILSGSGIAGSSGVLALALGLALFGIGMAVIYSGALYYAMEVGKAEVQAGGKHEALIGAGYTAGPMIGLFASVAVTSHWLAPGRFEPVVLGIVGAVAVGFASVVARRVLKHGQAG